MDAPLRLSRDYVRQGIREIAEDLCTRQLGYRTELDAAVAQRREVHQHRYTSLDRTIKRDATMLDTWIPAIFTVAKDPEEPDSIQRCASCWNSHTAERLKFSRIDGIGRVTSARTLWRVRQDFENVLRAMQRSADRQKTLAAHGVLMSDERLQHVVFEPSRSHNIGRQDLGAWGGRLLEAAAVTSCWKRQMRGSTTSATRRKWKRHGIAGACERIRSFGFESCSSEGRPALEIDDMGDSESILRNKRHLRETAQSLIRRGIVPQDDGWNGWLGATKERLRRPLPLLNVNV